MAAMENKFDCLSSEEIGRLGEALKDDKFRKMLLEYAEEISDPVKRTNYEKEIIELEKEQGIEAVFVHPKPGYALKTKDDQAQKVFVNICTNENVDCASCSSVKKSGGSPGGVNWNLPFLMSPCREDQDRNGGKCFVYDVIFHQDTLYMAQKNHRFKEMLEEAALDGIQERFGIKLDVQLRFPKLKYKGQPVATLLKKNARGEKYESDKSQTSSDFINFKKQDRTCMINTQNDLLSDCERKIQSDIGVPDYNDISVPKNVAVGSEKSDDTDENIKTSDNTSEECDKNNKDLKDSDVKYVPPIKPEHKIRYRDNIDLQDNALTLNSPNLRPNDLLVDVYLPLSNSVRDISLTFPDPKQLVLSSKNESINYYLSLNLPFPVNEENGSAKFDSDSHWLSVVLPIIPFQHDEIDSSDPKDIAEETEVEHACDFLDLASPEVHYAIPDFACHQTPEAVALTIKSTNGASLDFRLCGDCKQSLQLLYQDPKESTWHGLFLSFDIALTNVDLESNTDDKIKIIKLKKEEGEFISKFKYSNHWDTHNLKTYSFPTRENLINSFNKLKAWSLDNNCKPLENDQVKVENVSETTITINIKNKKIRPVNLGKFRTCSESSEELISPRSILKSVWRSSSESCSEDSCSTNHSESETKKSVRFNDHVLQNIFRANSSILGQKKKNQKRTQHKKKMKERRTSESSDYLSSENELV